MQQWLRVSGWLHWKHGGIFGSAASIPDYIASPLDLLQTVEAYRGRPHLAMNVDRDLQISSIPLNAMVLPGKTRTSLRLYPVASQVA